MGTVLPGRHGIEHNQASIVDPAVGVLEALGDGAFERAVAAEPEAFGTGEFFPLAQVIVEKQAGADHPGRPQVGAVRQDETHWLDDMRGLGQQDFALGQGFAYQAELVVLQIAQAAVDQLAAGRRGVAGEIIFFAKEHAKAAARSIRRNPYTIDAAADNGKVIDFGKGRSRQGGQGHEASQVFEIFEIEH